MINRSLIFASLCAILVGCRSSGSIGNQALHVDSTVRISIRVGDSLTWTLPANAGTGYSWTVVGDVPDCVVQVGEMKFIPDRVDTPGSSGTAHFTFRGVSKGQGAIRFEYSRPWEKYVKAARWASVVISVR